MHQPCVLTLRAALLEFALSVYEDWQMKAKILDRGGIL